MREPVQRKRREAKTTRVAQLEQKIDGLKALLEASNRGSSDRQITGLAVASSPNAYAVDTATPSSTGQSTSMYPTPETSISDEEEAVMLLDVFQTHMARHFPFVVVPQGTTVRRLRDEKPFLLKAIMTAASFKDMSRQAELARDTMRHLTEHMLFRNEKSFDLLQGLLVYIAW